MVQRAFRTKACTKREAFLHVKGRQVTMQEDKSINDDKSNERQETQAVRIDEQQVGKGKKAHQRHHREVEEGDECQTECRVSTPREESIDGNQQHRQHK